MQWFIPYHIVLAAVNSNPSYQVLTNTSITLEQRIDDKSRKKCIRCGHIAYTKKVVYKILASSYTHDGWIVETKNNNTTPPACIVPYSDEVKVVLNDRV